MWIFLTHYFNLSIADNIIIRAILSFVTSLLITLLGGAAFIRKLTARQIGQAIRDDGPQRHLQKSGTPTMGGILIFIAIIVSALVWQDLTNRYVWVTLFVAITFSIIGWVDDYRKVILKNSRGLPARWKYFWQSICGIVAAVVLYMTAQTPMETQLFIPFFNVSMQLGIFYILLAYFVIVGGSNAVNLTDGLDGLAIFPSILVASAFAVFAYSIGMHHTLSVNMPYVPQAKEIMVFCGAIAGAGLGFLWYNTNPAQVFMGDVGSLGLGATLGVIAMILRQELLFFIMGGIFVAETVSVILQVASFKSTGKRIFKMAPLHHHFELLGWAESKVIVRFWIVSIILFLVGMASLIRI